MIKAETEALTIEIPLTVESCACRAIGVEIITVVADRGI